MVLTDEQKTRVQEAFKLIARYKEDAREAASSAGEAMKNLVAEMTTDKTERKWLKKSFAKAFREYEENLRNEPDTLDDAVDIIAAVMPQGGA